MSFWDMSDGGKAAPTPSNEYEVPGGGNFDPIPAESSVLALIDEAKWDEKDSARFVSLRWSVLAPEAFKNRKVFHKLFVTDYDPTVKDQAKAVKKRDKARMMLAAIDGNAGGKLSASADAPTDETLQMHLTNKPMVIKLQVWEVQDRASGDTIAGNWVCAVSPKTKALEIGTTPPLKGKPKAQVGGYAGGSIMDDEIPF